MKTNISPELLAHYASGNVKLAYLLLVRDPRTSLNIVLTTAVETVDTGILLAEPSPMRAHHGLTVSAVKTTGSLAVDNFTFTVLDDGEIFTQMSMLTGLWDDAEVRLYRYSWAHPEWGVDHMVRGNIGSIGAKDGKILVEVRGLQQFLQAPIAIVTSKTCRARFNSAAHGCFAEEYSQLSYWADIDSVISNREFTVVYDMPQGEIPSQMTLNGSVFFEDGKSASLARSFRGPLSPVTYILLDAPLISGFDIGDRVVVRAGCGKTLEDCKTVYGQVLNFQGEPHLPGVDKMSKQ